MTKVGSYWVAIVHRISGIALAAFLPLHFWVLGNALHLDGFLAWTRQPLVKAAEWGIVVALAAHLGWMQENSDLVRTLLRRHHETNPEREQPMTQTAYPASQHRSVLHAALDGREVVVRDASPSPTEPANGHVNLVPTPAQRDRVTPQHARRRHSASHSGAAAPAPM